MDTIREWILTVCVVCIATGVINFLIPVGNVKRSAEISFALLLLISLISIFKADIISDISIEYSGDAILTYNDINSYAETMAKKETEEAIRDKLGMICTKEYLIDTEWDISESAYRLSAIIITISPEDNGNIEKIKSTVGSVTGVIPEVKASDENQRNTE